MSETRVMLTSESENRFSRQVLRYTVLFVITAVCTYALFIVLPRTFLSNAEGNIDGIAQQYPIYSEIKRCVHALLTGGGWDSWSWDIGLGDDRFMEFSTRLFNPLTYIVIAFPQKYLDIGFTLMVLVSQYLSGFTFMLAGRYRGFDYRQNISGGICYAFSGWVMQSILRQGTFLSATILFPLLILGIEKLRKDESPLIFIAAVAAHIAFSIQWAYVGAIAVVMFMIAGACTEKMSGRAFGKYVLKTAASGLAGAAISGIVLLDSLSKMLGTTTASTVEDQLLYPLSDYLNIPAGFFLTTPTTEAYTVLGLPALCVLMLPLIIRGARRRSPYAVMAVLLFVLSLLPVTGKVFNGFSYSVGRWYYVLVFFMVWSCMENYEPETFRDNGNVRVMRRWILAIALWSIVVCRLILDTIDLTEALTVLMGALISLMMLTVLAHGGLEKGRKYGLLLTAMLVVSIVGYVNTNLFPGLGEQIHTLCQVGRIERDFASSTQRAGVHVQAEDPGFYRIDQVDGYTDTRIARVRANENMYFGNRSIYTYLSTMDSDWHEFCRVMGNNAGYFDRTTVYSNDNREGLDLLMGVKYFIGDNPDMKPGASDYAPYGYEAAGETEGIQILRNRYCIGLGAAYDRYITESELMEYTPLEREQVMLQAAVVPDDQADKMTGITHASPEDISTDVRPVEVGFADFTNAEAAADADGGGVITIYSAGGETGTFSIELPQISSARVVLAFEGFTRDKADYDTNLALRGRIFSGNALEHAVKAASYEDNEKFKIEVTYGNIVKAAQMRKGKNQGYRDVEDFYINLGYFDEISGAVTVNIDRTGVYHYDSIRAYIVPVDIYEEAAERLEAGSLEISGFDGSDITGTVSAETDSVLYLSILDQDGWSISVDGEKLSGSERIRDINIAFTGVLIPAGEHEVTLEYHTPYVAQGCCMTVVGLVAAALMAAGYRKRKAARKDAGNDTQAA